MHFLQSSEWEKLQKDIGRKTWRVQGVLIVQHILPLGRNYLYIGGAPFEPQAFEEIKKIAKQERVMFLKWEPMTEGVKDERAFPRAGFRRSFKAIQPQRTITIDLAQSEEELLAQMHPKARYNIRTAQRHHVDVKASPGLALPGEFARLLESTARRDGFHAHPVEYYQKLAVLPFCELFVAEHEGRMAAAALILFFEGTATYLHGASDYALRHLMAPHLLHWEIMREAKKRGCARYDLWGIDERRWPGVTRFKRGFGGKEVSYIGSWDFIFHPFFYILYRLWNRRKD